MALLDFLFVLMGMSFVAIVAILLYAVMRKIKIDGEGNRGLLVSVIALTVVLLGTGAAYVALSTS
ncbi:hypothetical protein [Pseudarthrobacter sulfonivorans]|uniref:hypothetical protein n=1 Tax=Pseudarthrobacter sulfonivorans TaxID=121292 RepID=UPI00277EAAC9|nr:hypothetical protein [Pseudarthrobacter sulfonivorans]MDP9999033.1 uncharacterized membrane protein (DUF373 family) [Pseudarthrobacter sulfonivorans]